MTGRVLLLGSDTAWCEGLKINLEADGWQAVPVLKLENAAEELKRLGEPFAAAVIAAFGNRQSDGAGAAIRAAEVVRGIRSELPLLFDTSVPDYALTAFVLKASQARIAWGEKSGSIAAGLRILHSSSVTPKQSQPPRFAAIEISCEVASLTFAAALDRDTAPIGPYPVPWNKSPQLRVLNDRYKRFRLFRHDKEMRRRLVPDWSDEFKETGSQLCMAIGLDDGAQAAVLANYVRELKEIEHIHFRFNLPRDGMVHIPFELVWDTNKNRHLRELAPIARRLLLDEREVIVGSGMRSTGSHLTGDVLFILSPADGSLSVSGSQFAGARTFEAQKLEHIKKELDDLKKARKGAGLAAPKELVLSPDANQNDLVKGRLQNGLWDIVHFAGHSVCADNGEVFLLLPGKEGPIPLRIQDFAEAAQRGGARLIVLSSCESASPDAVFRLAQTGVSAAIGFRWEVDDKEAAEFTSFLHTGLAAGEPVGRAFHRAVSQLRKSHIDSPTFASPLLVIQDEEWAEPALSGSKETQRCQ